MSAPRIGFAGLTHLGINSAAAALARGFRVVGYDANKRTVEALSRGKAPVSEPGLDEILRSRIRHAVFTSDASRLGDCDLVFISADVSTDDEGRSELGSIRQSIHQVIPCLGKKAVLIVLCQVPPGFTRALEFPAARRYYQVETLVFGRAVERALHPERFIVGCADPAKPLPEAYRRFLAAFKCPVLPMRYESAELAKIAINCCLVSSVSVANTLAELCEGLGAVWSEIAPALKLDRRIGPHAYLSPGLGIAGGNLERDLFTILNFAKELQTDGGVVEAWIRNSRHRRDWAARTIRKAVLDANPGAAIAVWGLAYKENTNSTKNSPSLATIAQLPEVKFRIHDPVVRGSAVLKGKADFSEQPLDAVRGADALMILTPWPQYRKIPLAKIKGAMRGRVILDPCGVLDFAKACKAGFEVHTLGRQPCSST